MNKKTELLVKQVLSRLVGNSNEALANKIARKSISAWESNIANLKATIVDAETDLETAEESLQNTIYPTELFTDNKVYCQRIADAQSRVDSAQDRLDSLRNSLTYFENLLKKHS